MVTVAETIVAQMLPLPSIEAMLLVRRLIACQPQIEEHILAHFMSESCASS
jgi:hypothetical protein